MRFEIRPYTLIFTSQDVPLYAYVVADSDGQIEVLINGTSYTTINVTKGEQEVKIWDTVPLQQGYNKITFKSDETIKVFDAIYDTNAKMINVYDENGNPLTAVLSAVDMQSSAYKILDVAEAFALPVNYDILLEVVAYKNGKLYYYIGKLADTPENLNLPPCNEVEVDVYYDLAKVKEVLKRFMRIELGYIPDDEMGYMLDNADPMLLATMLNTYLGINLDIIRADIINDELVVAYRVKGGVPALVWAIIIGVIVIVGGIVLAELIKRVNMLVNPQYDAVRVLTRYEKARLDLINKIITKYPPDVAQKLIEAVNRASPTVSSSIEKLQTKPWYEQIPTWIIIVAVLVVAIILLARK